MGADQLTLAELMREAGERAADDFVREHPHPFLVSSGVLGVRLPKLGSDELAPESTAIIDIRPGVAHAPSASNPLAGQVHVVAKREEGEGVITVGRGDENDIVLVDPSVSNTHGYFERADDAVSVADIGSRNGTYVNQVRISVGDKIPLEDEDVVTFGRVSFQLFRPLALYMALRELTG
jgi:hypothetical protein